MIKGIKPDIPTHPLLTDDEADWDYTRIDIIATNGNDGLHYIDKDTNDSSKPSGTTNNKTNI